MTTEVAQEGQPATGGRGRLRQTMGDMARSLVPLLVIIGVLAWLHSPSAERLPSVDANGQFAAARTANAFPVLEPRGLPGGWRATSARVTLPDVKGQGPVTLDIGYRTASDHFARLVETDAAGADERYLGADRRDRGAVDVGGRTWRRSQVGRRDEALVSVDSGRTTLVTGDAPLSELRTLAAALR